MYELRCLNIVLVILHGILSNILVVLLLTDLNLHSLCDTNLYLVKFLLSGGCKILQVFIVFDVL